MSIITKALVVGVNLLEFQKTVMHMANIAGDWRSDPDLACDVLHRAADAWHMVEIASEVRASVKK